MPNEKHANICEVSYLCVTLYIMFNLQFKHIDHVSSLLISVTFTYLGQHMSKYNETQLNNIVK